MKWKHLFVATALANLCLAQPATPELALDPLTIEQAVNEALRENLDLLASRYNVPIADARLVTASLRPNPVFSFEGTHLDLLGTGYDAINGAGPAEFSLRTDFVLERGGKRRERVEVARAERTVAELELLDAMRQLILDVQGAFVDVLQAKADLAVSKEILATFEEIVRINRSRVRSGDLAAVELVRSEVAQIQFENEVRQAELRLETARMRLGLLLGRRQTDRRVDAVGEMRRDSNLNLNPNPRIPSLMRETAFERRPDLRAGRESLIRSRADLRLQVAQGKVDYVVGTEYRRQQGLAGRGNSLGLFFQANIPVFDRNQGEVARAHMEQLQAQARIRAIEARIENEVTIAHMQYQNAQAILERIEGTLLKKAQEVRQISEYSYRRGEATFLEFLDAQRAYSEAVLAYNAARAEYARSLYAVDAVMGISVPGGTP